jgi:TPP-dependent 2-oxoacid decarboxylase
MQVMIFCDRPGYVRAEQRHPEFATYFAGRFSAAQLRELIADRHLTVCVGHQLTADQVDDFVSKNTTPESVIQSVEAAEGKAASTDAGGSEKPPVILADAKASTSDGTEAAGGKAASADPVLAKVKTPRKARR